MSKLGHFDKLSLVLSIRSGLVYQNSKSNFLTKQSSRLQLVPIKVHYLHGSGGKSPHHSSKPIDVHPNWSSLCCMGQDWWARPERPDKPVASEITANCNCQNSQIL